jgi:hypothetical protein
VNELRRRIRLLERVQSSSAGFRLAGRHDRRSVTLALSPRLIRHLHVRLRHERRRLGVAIARLRIRARQNASWLATYGVFRVCPVPGYTDINDNYGITVRIPDVPVHRHTGVDVAAPTGSPIVAPFDGYVSTTRSELGGLEVRIAGEAGYVYNAHAAAAAAYGWVDAGTVIGYVGATGDATAPHVHLEWHPGDGLAVDPYVYVVAACVRAP